MSVPIPPLERHIASIFLQILASIAVEHLPSTPRKAIALRTLDNLANILQVPDALDDYLITVSTTPPTHKR